MILIEQINPAGQRVVLESRQALSGRGRVLEAHLRLLQGDQLLWEGPDTQQTAQTWQPLLDQALAGDLAGQAEEPAVPQKARKRKDDGNH